MLFNDTMFDWTFLLPNSQWDSRSLCQYCLPLSRPRLARISKNQEALTCPLMFIKILIGLLTAALTATILASTVEVIYNVDLPVVRAIEPIESGVTIDKLIQTYSASGVKTYTTKTGALGELDFLTIPALGSRVFIARERKIDGDWFLRPNNIHSIPLNYDAFNNPGDYLFYTKKSFNSIPDPANLEIGDELQVTNTRGKSTSFAIEDKQVLPQGEPYIASDTGLRQIILLVEDQDANVYYIFTAR